MNKMCPLRRVKNKQRHIHSTSLENIMSTETLEKTARSLFEQAFNGRDLDLIDRICAPEFVGHSTPVETYGPEGLRDAFIRLLSAFGGARFTVHDILAHGDLVALRVTLHGTHEGEYLGVPPTGKEIDLHGNILARFRDGRMVESWPRYDQLGLLIQLGAYPMPIARPSEAASVGAR
ncbi:MAG: ester cyclase [Thermoleophilia bacterium]|nr:ester cyclase [Thermoleophilia bacterium]